ncbi:bifunctional (p)ppGpp synthetase/guanosine-3',5'-bis(diphosphate) 3'-pyrophosphohydrolase [Ruminococcaceae bacterium OttesenSCG-928-D13]|nr:bifunctional (p)ppGpp synthetase/guanosine-3',5'-bis(diphosphate) 3'-pyrophosphohydrolase [Ruminococcaceae bacterium OttesenSCG-928-D13]
MAPSEVKLPEVKPITYVDFRALAVESGRPYDFERLDAAYALADAAHAGQNRRSGEPYVTHPVAVATLLLELGLDTEALTAALLHDVVEDTEIPLEEIVAQFGPEVAALVDGVTKLGLISFSSMEEEQAENLRKMLLAMSKDVRVMLIKLCDRLHNMRTASAWPAQKRRDKALETMEVYAPIAHRLGISGIKEELEDLSLAILDAYGYADIIEQMGRKVDALSYVQKIAGNVQRNLTENDLPNAVIHSRVKSIYSIYRKMYIQGRSFEEIYDTYAIRIILDTIPECYTALGVIHDMYHPLPNRFKDYISTPKPNMYQSLHTTVISHEGIAFEIQIRTHEMDQLAEYGVAAHWKYKAGLQGQDKLEERLAWVRQLLESQRDAEDGGELLRDIKSELIPEEVYVFTPKGDVIDLPSGATVIDFAYAIHSAVGNRMTGAKVNGRIVPIDHKVLTGEVIEVLTGNENKGPSRDWLNIVTTSEAKSKIRHWFKKERREENITEGKAALDKELRRNQITIPADQYDEFMENIAHRQRMNSAEEMYGAIGYGGLQLARILPKLREEYQKLVKSGDPVETFEIPVKPRKEKASEGVVVEGIDNVLVKFAKCCNPLPGDPIVGFITRGYGVSIHKQDCVNARPALSNPRWLNAHWAEGIKESFTSTLEVTALNRDRLFADISSLLADMRVPIYSINARSGTDGRASITLTIGIQNTEHLTNVISRLRKIKEVTDIQRT